MTMVLLVLATCGPVGASEIRIKLSDLDHFIGTFDADEMTFTDFTIAEWDTLGPMGFHNAIAQFPDDNGVYFGLSPWYTGVARAVLPFPEKGLTFVSLVDIKLSYSARAIVTKWRNVGDSLEFICVMRDFPDLGGAPNLDGCFLLPDSSHFMMVRSAGGGMESIWRRFSFILEEPGCRWLEVYRLESEHLMFEPEFTESWCRLIDSLAPDYYLKVIRRYFEPKGEKKPDGSYDHQNVRSDTTLLNLWDLVQKARK